MEAELKLQGGPPLVQPPLMTGSGPLRAPVVATLVVKLAQAAPSGWLFVIFSWTLRPCSLNCERATDHAGMAPALATDAVGPASFTVSFARRRFQAYVRACGWTGMIAGSSEEREALVNVTFAASEVGGSIAAANGATRYLKSWPGPVRLTGKFGPIVLKVVGL